jgi:hypothetical protein
MTCPVNVTIRVSGYAGSCSALNGDYTLTRYGSDCAYRYIGRAYGDARWWIGFILYFFINNTPPYMQLLFGYGENGTAYFGKYPPPIYGDFTNGPDTNFNPSCRSPAVNISVIAYT